MTGKITSTGMENAPLRVMLVDDSSVIRAILKQMLTGVPFVQIIGEAENGLIAIEKTKELNPDIILLDIEMPEMDGISALPHILKASPLSQIIMVSTLTEKNAEISIKAMSLGASDYLQKPEANIDKVIFKVELLEKIKALGTAARNRKSLDLHAKTTIHIPKIIDKILHPHMPSLKHHEASFKPSVIAIASSTGGPQALQVLFEGLKHNLPNLPIFLTQHMPPVFTKYLATSLATATGLKFHEAHNGMEALPGNIYIAPGDFHMLVENTGLKIKIKLTKDAAENYCRPAADPMFRSISDVYGNNILAVILTGMGQDGMLGAKIIAEKGGIVIAQDKDSSVVWGMPGAVCTAGITNGIYPIDKIAARIIEICNGKGAHHAPK